MLSQPSKPKPKAKNYFLEFEAIGTKWTIEIFNAQNKNYETIIKNRTEEFDKNYSRFRTDSLITAMSKSAGSYKLPEDAKPMIDLYKELYDISEGLITPMIGQTLSDAGYDAGYTFKPKRLFSPPEWNECLDYNFPELTVKIPVLLDLGALGKGYLVDIIAKLLEENKCHNFVINAGGDILHYGNKNIEVALENPENSSEAIGVAKLRNAAICGSAGNRRKWGDFNHIIDPKKLASPSHIKALWVTAGTAMLTDGLTTALYFVKPETLLKRYTFNYAIVSSDLSLTYSKNFPAKFFNSES